MPPEAQARPAPGVGHHRCVGVDDWLAARAESDAVEVDLAHAMADGVLRDLRVAIHANADRHG